MREKTIVSNSYYGVLFFSDHRSFEKVLYGGKQIEDPSKHRDELALENKYAALQDWCYFYTSCYWVELQLGRSNEDNNDCIFVLCL